MSLNKQKNIPKEIKEESKESDVEGPVDLDEKSLLKEEFKKETDTMNTLSDHLLEFLGDKTSSEDSYVILDEYEGSPLHDSPEITQEQSDELIFSDSSQKPEDVLNIFSDDYDIKDSTTLKEDCNMVCSQTNSKLMDNNSQTVEKPAVEEKSLTGTYVQKRKRKKLSGSQRRRLKKLKELGRFCPKDVALNIIKGVEEIVPITEIGQTTKFAPTIQIESTTEIGQTTIFDPTKDIRSTSEIGPNKEIGPDISTTEENNKLKPIVIRARKKKKKKLSQKKWERLKKFRQNLMLESKRRFLSPERSFRQPRTAITHWGHGRGQDSDFGRRNKRRSNSPRRRSNSPRRRSNSPRRRSNSPRLRSNSPKRRLSTSRRSYKWKNYHSERSSSSHKGRFNEDMRESCGSAEIERGHSRNQRSESVTSHLPLTAEKRLSLSKMDSMSKSPCNNRTDSEESLNSFCFNQLNDPKQSQLDYSIDNLHKRGSNVLPDNKLIYEFGATYPPNLESQKSNYRGDTMYQWKGRDDLEYHMSGKPVSNENALSSSHYREGCTAHGEEELGSYSSVRRTFDYHDAPGSQRNPKSQDQERRNNQCSYSLKTDFEFNKSEDISRHSAKPYDEMVYHSQDQDKNYSFQYQTGVSIHSSDNRAKSRSHSEENIPFTHSEVAPNQIQVPVSNFENNSSFSRQRNLSNTHEFTTKKSRWDDCGPHPTSENIPFRHFKVISDSTFQNRSYFSCSSGGTPSNDLFLQEKNIRRESPNHSPFSDWNQPLKSPLESRDTFAQGLSFSQTSYASSSSNREDKHESVSRNEDNFSLDRKRISIESTTSKWKYFPKPKAINQDPMDVSPSLGNNSVSSSTRKYQFPFDANPDQNFLIERNTLPIVQTDNPEVSHWNYPHNQKEMSSNFSYSRADYFQPGVSNAEKSKIYHAPQYTDISKSLNDLRQPPLENNNTFSRFNNAPERDIMEGRSYGDTDMRQISYIRDNERRTIIPDRDSDLRSFSCEQDRLMTTGYHPNDRYHTKTKSSPAPDKTNYMSSSSSNVYSKSRNIESYYGSNVDASLKPVINPSERTRNFPIEPDNRQLYLPRDNQTSSCSSKYYHPSRDFVRERGSEPRYPDRPNLDDTHYRTGFSGSDWPKGSFR